MRFLSTALVALSALSAFVFAQENPISSPTAGTVLVAGQDHTITWNPTTQGSVTLVLRKGDSKNLDTLNTIAADIANTGSFDWTVPENVESGEDYSVEIMYPGGSNFSPQFTIESNFVATRSTTEVSTTETSTTTTSAATSIANSTMTTTTETTITSFVSTTTAAPNSTTVTSGTGRPRTTSKDENENDGGAPDPNNSAMGNSIPMAMFLCVGAAFAYLA
ncbi:Ser-Thr-rich glycosyl-phosphatidyl-inositol-anchored membrane family-domain-containing protein [Kalaharituber pfeilii]|nr:Ser-Thr-rich glycosyl-phosphatidyl-inositol-anchored membrane family-domain-containing protein [Kalaharituber pfeilii]